jgi:hypothetical protein
MHVRSNFNLVLLTNLSLDLIYCFNSTTVSEMMSVKGFFRKEASRELVNGNLRTG